MTDTFKPVVEGMEFHVIDGTGFPDAVLVSNGSNVMDGTYIDKYYYPPVYAKWKPYNYETPLGKTFHNLQCSNCQTIFNEGMSAEVFKYCPMCGAIMDER